MGREQLEQLGLDDLTPRLIKNDNEETAAGFP